MNNQMMIFEGKEVEVFELNGIVYFNPYHVGQCLNLTDSAVRKAMGNMNDKQAIKLTNSIVKDIHFRKLHSTGELFLTESGVYKLVFRSNKPKAEKFTDWVTDEVLPAIRKEGKYEIDVKKVNENNNLIQEEKKQLEKAVITTNYLVEYISSKNSPIPKDIFSSLKTSIMAVNIEIVDYLEKLNNLQIKKIS